MPTSITVPETSYWSTSSVELSRKTFDFTYTLNERFETPRLYLTIHQEGNLVKAGIKLLGSKNITGPYILEEFSEGILMVLRMTEDIHVEPTIGNIGIDKDFELVYYTFDELEEAGI